MDDHPPFFRSSGGIFVQSLTPCPNRPHLKKKIGRFSYLKESQTFFWWPVEIRIPLLNGLCASNWTFKQQNSPFTTDQITLTKVDPTTCIKFFLSHFGGHNQILSQNGERTSRILLLSTGCVNLSKIIIYLQKNHGQLSKINSKSSSSSNEIKNKFWSFT